MNLIAMKCPSCGSNVEVDSYSTQYTCSVCGTTTLIEKDNFTSSYHDESIVKADRLFEEKQYKDATDKYEYMTSSYSDDPRVWIGLIRGYTHDLQAKMYIDVSPYKPIWLNGFEKKIMDIYHKYLSVETKETEKTNVSNIFTQYVNDNKNEYQELLNKNQNETVDKIDIIPNSADSKSNYDDTIKAENKIITAEEIKEIVLMMQDKLNMYQYISQKEVERNEQYSFDMREYTFKDNGSSLKYQIDFLDDTEVKIDNTEEFLYLYESRLSEIKSMDVFFHLNYDTDTIVPKKEHDYKSQSINLYIYQHKLDINVKLLSDDDLISDVYAKIKKMVLSAPPKYDDIVRKRTAICLLSSLGFGMIPSAIICALLCISPLLRQVFAESIILLPIIGILIAFALGEIIQNIILGPLYDPIKPEQKYAGYKDGKSIHVDDVEDFTKKSEILIGKNVNNLENRKKIRELYNKSLKFMFGGFIVILVITTILVVLGRM